MFSKDRYGKNPNHVMEPTPYSRGSSPRWAAEMKSYSTDMRAELLDEYEQKTEESLLLLWHKGHVA
jgi:hypothetical protein